jgi:hypothetical protein
LLKRIPARSTAALTSGYTGPETWPTHVNAVALPLALLALLYSVVPSSDRLGRIASFGFLLIAPYFAWLAVDFAWYYPPFALLAIVTFGCVAGTAGRIGFPRAVIATVLAGIALERADFEFDFMRLMKFQQAVIEDGNRKQVGLYLRNRAGPGQTVMLEALGYIGYFSKARMLDWPGLVAPEVTEVLRRHVSLMGLVDALRPDWLCLRPRELLQIERERDFRDDYELDRVFDVSKKLDAYGDHPGRPYMSNDSVFYVYRRKAGQ